MIAEESATPGLRAVLEVSELCTVLRTPSGEQRPVDGVTFDLARGETLAIVGESGSGKSMTALSIVGLLPKVARVAGGHAYLAGEDLLALGAKEMRARRGLAVAYMPQDPVSALNPSLTIGRQVVEPLLVHRSASRQEAAERALELLGRLGLPDLPGALDAYPHQLSGGMRQRVLLAMSLIGRPQVLIADEPTTSVDVTTQEQIVDLLSEIQAQTALAIVIITHDLGVVARIAQRVLVMYAGRVVEHGDAEQIFEQPMHPYTRGLLRSVEFDTVEPRTHLFALDGIPPQLADLPIGCSFHPRCPHRIQVCVEVVPPLAPVPGGSGLSACHLATRGDLPPAGEDLPGEDLPGEDLPGEDLPPPSEYLPPPGEDLPGEDLAPDGAAEDRP